MQCLLYVVVMVIHLWCKGKVTWSHTIIFLLVCPYSSRSKIVVPTFPNCTSCRLRKMLKQEEETVESRESIVKALEDIQAQAEVALCFCCVKH